MFDQTVKIIKDKIGSEPIEVGLILGSGLGEITKIIKGVSISYSELPGFPETKVSGHAGQLKIGSIGKIRLAIMSGRSHYYERGDSTTMRTPLEILQHFGMQSIILTNAAGSLISSLTPGDLMLVRDHINFSGINPLIGETGDKKFVNMSQAYDSELQKLFENSAFAEDVVLNKGNYAWFSGPSFETPAEINAVKILGADAVGMSTVPEVIISRFLNIRVAAISIITNMGAGLSDEVISHDHTKKIALVAQEKLKKILQSVLRNYK